MSSRPACAAWSWARPSAPGIEDAGLLHAVFQADLAAFGVQRPEFATRYRNAALSVTP